MKKTTSSTALNVLLLGSGGREHAIATSLAKSPRLKKLYAAPGNGGISELAECVALDPSNSEEVLHFVRNHAIDFVVIGPEAPLVAGVSDALRAEGIAVFGPSQAAAMMEGSKHFAKSIMQEAGVATAAYESFCTQEAALEYIDKNPRALVVKADGLAAGKGVFVCSTAEEAREAVHACFEQFGAPGSCVVIEELLEGPECSLLALTDGTTLLPLSTAQDHKRAYDGDAGPNTGGMGVYSPVAAVDDQTYSSMCAAMQRVLDCLRKKGTPYTGCLYGGFMLTEQGPYVLEFNARFGDPETQVILPRLQGDVLELMLACDEGTLADQSYSFSDDCAVSVVLASKGYPEAYATGKEITGIASARALNGVELYHAGTRKLQDGTVVTAGGRVLNVTALAPSMKQAQVRAYEAAQLIDFEGMWYRHDIASRAC